MAYSLIQSKQAYEAVRQALLKATNHRLDVDVVVADADFTAAIADENERYEFIWSRNQKDYRFSEIGRLTAGVNFAGPAAGDGDVTICIGSECFTFTPAAGDADLEMANALINEINGNSSNYTARLSGTSTCEIIPLNDNHVPQITDTITDTGAIASYVNPFGIYLGGSMQLQSTGLSFDGTSSKVI